MANGKLPKLGPVWTLLLEQIRDLLIEQIARRLRSESRKTEALVARLEKSTTAEVERAKVEIIEKLTSIESSIEVIAREFARKQADER
jgi:hypothetical protein